MRITVDEVAWDHPVGTRLRAEQERETIERYGGDLENGGNPNAADIALFLLATDTGTGEIVGCGGLRRLDPHTHEIKRTYVVPSWRGRRIGWELLRAVEGATRTRRHPDATGDRVGAARGDAAVRAVRLPAHRPVRPLRRLRCQRLLRAPAHRRRGAGDTMRGRA